MNECLLVYVYLSLPVYICFFILCSCSFPLSICLIRHAFSLLICVQHFLCLLKFLFLLSYAASSCLFLPLFCFMSLCVFRLLFCISSSPYCLYLSLFFFCSFLFALSLHDVPPLLLLKRSLLSHLLPSSFHAYYFNFIRQLLPSSFSSSSPTFSSLLHLYLLSSLLIMVFDLFTPLLRLLFLRLSFSFLHFPNSLLLPSPLPTYSLPHSFSLLLFLLVDEASSAFL